MNSLQFKYFAFCVLITWQQIYCEDEEDDDIKGPMMKVKPDGQLFTTGELIEQHNKKSETHKVTTDDGYILSVFRVLTTSSKSPPLSPILLHHGYLSSSDAWVTDADALAFKLSDAGFDVWINNARGNAYSRNHNKLKPEEKEFWNFSWHEMGTKDLPAVIDYILNKTNQSSLHYVGHSMGTSIGYVMASEKPEYSEKMKSFVNLSPAVYVSKLVDMFGPDGMVEDMAARFMDDFKQSEKYEVFPRSDLMNNNKTQITCQDLGESFQGMCESNLEEVYKFLGGPYLPAGTSFQTMFHFYQMSSDGEMRHFNMSSKEENQKVYGSDDPPKYTDKFNLIKTPVLLWAAEADQIIKSEDVDKLVSKLPNVVSRNVIKEECFNHMTFLFSNKKSCLPVREKLYKDCIEAMLMLEKK